MSAWAAGVVTTTSVPRTKVRLIAGAASVLAALVANADEALIEQGRYLTHAGGCITCHTRDADDAVPLAGGRAMDTPFGTFYSPNITPDMETGIGGWTDDDFVTAFWEGVSPDGDHYFPSFPYTAYTGASRDDLLAIKAYLFSLDPVQSENAEHDLAWYMSSRTAVGGWKALNFDAARFEPDPEKDDEWNRGAYLVRHLGHCAECHTARSRTGVLQHDEELAGAILGEEKIPNITQHPSEGIGRWSARDIEYFLDIGMLPDGDFTGSSMVAVVEDSTTHLTREDRLAMAAYLKSLPERESTNE